ncbi:MAG: pantoate--beta-alanine ligase [Desulfobulbaceae bacterium]|jgi:pantoate--beta-alanine ligase|nr:pantoate--beta-alanine ligase [Desulfobulbaceae bacterium]
MRRVATIAEMRQCRDDWRRQGLSVALAPTMGFFHEGHLALMRRAKTLADRVVVSLFVNPLQFGPNEDLASYPRDLERDAALAAEAGVDALFIPTTSEMYGADFQTKVVVSGLSQGLCGASRPGHFDGVATVVTKLFHIVAPDVAVFGEKDFQQLAVLKRMAADLHFNLRIVSQPIVREQDGLAMSSRNSYLTAAERQSAVCLSQSLALAKQLARDESVSVAAIEQAVTEYIEKQPGFVVEYASVVDGESLRHADAVGQNSLLALAARVNGRVRLIDNAMLRRS